MRRISWLLAVTTSLALCSPQDVSASPIDPSHYSFGGILFPIQNPNGVVRDLSWRKTPELSQVEAALPSGAKSAGRTEWSCAIAATGRLQDCQLTAEWPSDQGFAAAARKLLPLFQVTPQVANDALRTPYRAIFEIHLEDDARQVQNIPGNCPPPFCSAIPPPPPPPLR